MSKDIGFCSITEDLCKKDGKCEDCSLKHIHENIEHYAKLHEENRLIELLCKVGDTVYAIRYGESKPFIIVETHIVEIRNNLHGWFFIPNENMRGFRLGDFGKTVFTTKEEAEAKLAELKGE